MNMTQLSPEEKISRVFRAISTPVRFRILAAIGTGEACVCHLEALLDLRQAYISQQLMELREADLLETRREGRYIFYRLVEPKLVDALIELSALLGISAGELEALLNTDPLPQCCCPKCVARLKPALITEEEVKNLSVNT
jgi:DNA-binding transcriptional ArsR family regulator